MSDTEIKGDFKSIVEKLKPYESEWCPEISADIMMLPHGYVIGTYDIERDMLLSRCFVPHPIQEKVYVQAEQDKPKFKNFLFEGTK